MTQKFEKFTSIQLKKEPSILTGIKTVDSWWSADGGIVIGSAIFLTGTSGSGKTTLSVFLAKIFNKHKTIIYSREMNRRQLKQQTSRLNVNHDNLLIADAETCPKFSQFMETLEEEKPKFIIVDSLQVVSLEDYSEENQENAQYEIIKSLREWTENNNAVLIVIGHNTKEGEFRGANTIKQMFDAHLEMTFLKKNDSRTMAWSKNRKGPLGMLYYEFTKDSIIFYTEEEWKNKGKEFSVVSELKKVILRIYAVADQQPKDKVKVFEKKCNEDFKEEDLNDLNEFEKYVKILEITEKHFKELMS